jgi:hypothetical protein
LPQTHEALDFRRTCGQIARHENRQRDLHYRLHYYPLSIAGGAVFFIPIFTTFLKSP